MVLMTQLFILLDSGATVLGQPSEYWLYHNVLGKYPNEANPVAAFLMWCGLEWFVLGTVVYVALVTLGILRLQYWRYIGTVITMVHFCGLFCWMGLSIPAIQSLPGVILVMLLSVSLAYTLKE